MSKKALVSFASMALISIVACSSSSTTSGGSSGGGGTDSGVKADANAGSSGGGGVEPEMDAGFVNSVVSDGSVTLGCTTQASCAGNSAGTACCGDLNVSGSGLNCSFDSLNSGCATTCVSQAFTGCMNTKVKPCSKTTDCSDQTASGNTSCCTFNGSGSDSFAFCFNPTLASLAGATCM
jgi:hypothetical protein